MKQFVAMLLLALLSDPANAGDLRSFTSDGCSAFPDGTLGQQDLWLQCCREHDRRYWAGGSYAARQQADKLLGECVAGVGEPAIARLMLGGVRVGGTPYLPTSFRWGYGWPYPRGYKVLNATEQAAVANELRKVTANIHAD